MTGPTIDRRHFLHVTAAGAAATVAAVGTPASSAAAADGGPFRHGVASGDPLPDAVILWTRISGVTAPTPVRWELATDPAMAIVVAAGDALATAERDWTVKVDAGGLDAGTTYWYRFTTAAGARSPAGRTRTAPVGRPQRLRFAFVSCSHYRDGWFNPYARLGRKADLDFVVHLGDYIYETAGAGSLGRAFDPPKELTTLDDYRRRYAQYRSDPDLQEAHRQHPWIVVWDDHESSNNSWASGARNHTEGAEGEWEQRKRWSAQVYDEWLPIRLPDRDNPLKIWRSFVFGDLVDLLMIDTRLYGRSAGDTPTTLVSTGSDDPTRTMLGPEQYGWLTGELLASKQRDTAWRIIGNQTMISPHRNNPTDPPLPYLPPEVVEELGAIRQGGGNEGSDNWGAYRVERDRLMAYLREQRIANNVVLTGDIHTSWAADVVEDPFTPYHATSAVTGAPGYDPVTGLGSVAVELVAMSVSSNNFEESTDPTAPAQVAAFNTAIVAGNPNVAYCDVAGHGYVLVDVTRERVQAEWWETGSAHVHAPERPERLAGMPHPEAGTVEPLRGLYQVRAGAAGEPFTNHLLPATAPTEDRVPTPPLAPDDGPPPAVPEIGSLGLLPLAGLGALGAVVALRNRRPSGDAPVPGDATR